MLDRVQDASAVAGMFCNPGADGIQHIYFMGAEDGPSKVLTEFGHRAAEGCKHAGPPGWSTPEFCLDQLGFDQLDEGQQPGSPPECD